MIRAVFMVEALISILFVTFVCTQIIIPGFRGLPFFPILRHPRQKAMDDLVESRERAEVRRIRKEISKV